MSPVTRFGFGPTHVQRLRWSSLERTIRCLRCSLLVAISSTGIIAKRSGHWTLRLERQDRVSQLSKSSWPFLTFSSKKRKILKGVLIFMMVRENLEALLLCVYQPFYDLEIFFDGVVVLSAIASSIKCWGICVRITIREMRSRLDYGLLA
jgi:hypothetical protein